MKSLALLALLLPVAAFAHDLTPLAKPELATVLGLLEEVAPAPPAGAEQPYFVRVYSAPTGVYECDGTVASCPDVRLFVTVSSGDLGETPVLYQLPAQKGWEFVGWSEPSGTGDMASFTVRTTLPGTNIDASSRKAWRPQVYRVFVSPEHGSYVQHEA